MIAELLARRASSLCAIASALNERDLATASGLWRPSVTCSPGSRGTGMSVPATHDEESVSDVIVLKEATPETADVSRRLMPVMCTIYRELWWRSRRGGVTNLKEKGN